jgi:hypothetical protein
MLNAIVPCTLTVCAPEYLIAIAAKHTITWLKLHTTAAAAAGVGQSALP